MRILDNRGYVQDPFHPGVSILDKLMNDLKSKLPFGKKNQQSEQDEELTNESTNPHTESHETNSHNLSSDQNDLEDEDSTLPKKQKTKIFGWKKNKVAAEDEDNTDDEFEDGMAPAKKKKNSKLIQLIVVLGLLVIIGQELFMPEETPSPKVVTVAKPRYKKNVVVKKEETAVTEVDQAVSQTDEPVADANLGSQNGETQTIPTPTEGLEADTASSQKVPEETPVTETSEPDLAKPTNTEPPTSDIAAEENSSTDTTTSSPGGVTSEDSIDAPASSTSDENLTEKMLLDLEKQASSTKELEPVKEYVSPPDYEFRGRGLVYNCTGKHWACVDAPSYQACVSNSASTKFLGKPVECHPYSIFETQKGCESVQKSMVSSSYKTNFCSTN